MLQTHLNHLATFRSADRVLHARSCLKGIFSEAVEQEFLLTVPTNVREKDRTVLSWDQLRLVLGGLSSRGRLLLTLEMTEALRPSELSGLRWQFFDGNKLAITETVYKGAIRPWGKTRKSLGDMHLPKGLAEGLWLWKQESSHWGPDDFIFPNNDGGAIDTANYRRRVLAPLATKLGLPKLTFQVLRRTMATLAQSRGSVKDIQAHLRHTKADTTANVYMQELPESVKQMVDSVYTELLNRPQLVKGG